jgi:hypothetical protein|tara:strand:- start:760 stop:1341 length:582 start_codon:yes stop_codon:yes gene_type:complete
MLNNVANILALKILLLTVNTFAVCPLIAAETGSLSWIKSASAETRAGLKNYSVHEFRFGGESAEGASGFGYVNSVGEVKYVEVTYSGERGFVDYEYYYFTGTPYFALEQRHIYNVPFYMTEKVVEEWREEGIEAEAFDPKKTNLIERRYYFRDGVLMKSLGTVQEDALGNEGGLKIYAAAIKNRQRLLDSLSK